MFCICYRTAVRLGRSPMRREVPGGFSNGRAPNTPKIGDFGVNLDPKTPKNTPKNGVFGVILRVPKSANLGKNRPVWLLILFSFSPFWRKSVFDRGLRAWPDPLPGGPPPGGPPQGGSPRGTPKNGVFGGLGPDP